MKSEKRIDKVYSCIEKYLENLSFNELVESEGVTTEDIALDTGLVRSNVSFELNALYKRGRLIKIKKRPVRFITTSKVEAITRTHFDSMVFEFDSLAQLLEQQGVDFNQLQKTPYKDIFSRLIGHDRSLKSSIEQAKAAVLYPPDGLNTLILGPSGVGKSHFAQLMHDFAADEGVLNGPLIVFNCADYYNNPQLLMSHLFGHINGAFTGASNDKEGLVEKANGGVLFLDEIHRLPPEGQEMIFYILDNGNFCRLGETERKRKSQFRFICATTENPDSALLQTFIRRIPVVINIPPVQSRTVEEKIGLVEFLIHEEAKRIKKPILIDKNSIKALIGSAKNGNVGQVKSNIQLICANGYIRNMRDKQVKIEFETIPFSVKNGYYEISRQHSESNKMDTFLEEEIIILPEGNEHKIYLIDEFKPSFDLYSIIEQRHTALNQLGIPEKEINRLISQDIEGKLLNITNKMKGSAIVQEKIAKLVSPEVLSFTFKMTELVDSRYSEKLGDKFLIAFSLHLSAYIDGRAKKRNLPPLKAENQNQYSENILAEEIAHHAEKILSFRLPQEEISYISLLIRSLRQRATNEKVTILVVMHGQSTASSMVNLVKELLSEEHVVAVDMPFDMTPNAAMEVVRNQVCHINRGKGVLIMVDMGSLINFGDVITHETGIPTRTVHMVSTPLVIEAVRKAGIIGIHLDEVYTSLKNFRGYELNRKPSPMKTPERISIAQKTILAICSTGIGTALKLKTLIEDMLYEEDRHEIYVMAMSLSQAKEKRTELKENNHFICAVGIKDPVYGIPFISIEELFSFEGEQRLKNIVEGRTNIDQISRPPLIARTIILESLRDILTFLNPYKLIDLLIKFIDRLEEIERKQFDGALKVNLGLHVANALERVIQGNTLNISSSNIHDQRLGIYQEAATIFRDSLGVTLNDSELSCIIEIIDELSINIEHCDQLY